MSVGKLARQVRLARGMSQSQLARSAGLTQSQVSHLEGDDRVTEFAVLQVAQALSCPDLLFAYIRSLDAFRAACKLSGFCLSREPMQRQLQTLVAALPDVPPEMLRDQLRLISDVLLVLSVLPPS